MGLFHPWRWLRSQPHIDVSWTRLDGLLGRTDGADRIEMHSWQSQVQRRCTITHELIHVGLGHIGGCEDGEEQRVRAETARRLITLEALLDALAWTQDWHEAAEQLWVTVEVLRDRIDHLNDAERAMLVRRYEEVERGA